MKKSSNFTLSPIYLALFTGSISLSSSASFAAECNHQSVTEGFNLSDQTSTKTFNQCTANLTHAKTQNTFDFSNNTQIEFNQANITGELKNMSGHFGGFYFINNDKSNLNINNSSITLNNPNDQNSFLGGSATILSNNANLNIKESNLKRSSNTDGNVIVWAENATVNISNTTFESYRNEAQSSFYRTPLLDLRDSKITLNNNKFISQQSGYGIYVTNGSLSSVGNKLEFTNGTLPLLDSNNATVISKNDTFILTRDAGKDSFYVRPTISMQNSNVTLDSPSITQTNGDSFFSIKDSTFMLNNPNLKHSGTTNSTLFDYIENTKNNITVNNLTTSVNTAFRVIDGRVFDKKEITTITLNNSNITADSLSSNSFDSHSLVVAAQKSTLIGNMLGSGIKHLNLIDSHWNLSKTSSVTNLEAKNSNISFVKRDDSRFTTLSIEGNLSGSAHFSLNSDLSKQISDQITVSGAAEGSHTLEVHNSGDEPTKEGGRVTLVETKSGSALFKLQNQDNKDYVDAGAYRYHLNKEGTNWVLSNKVEEKPVAPITPSKPIDPVKPVVPVAPSTPVEPVKPVTPSTPVEPAEQIEPVIPSTPVAPIVPITPDEVVLSEKSNALVSLKQAQILQLEQGINNIHQRLGELKSTGNSNVWVRNLNTRNKFDRTYTATNSRTSGFNQNLHSLEVGVDFAVSERIRLGGFVGNARSNVDFSGNYGSGKVKNQTVGIYGTFLANNGFYWDNIAKYARVKSESAVTGERRYNGYTLSTEIGRHHNVGHWTITPQLQAAWTKLSSKADEDGISALTARAGVRVANHLDFAGWKFEPYVELNGITTRTNQNAVRVNQYSFDVAETKGRIESAIGANAVVGNHRIGLEASLTNGKYLDQPYKVQLAYRYHW
ncbi:autotransporter outer membrane beta-barrel domain-containing protein [Actinobacillus equuli]|uniref:autotransporter outer membrane beta-barrel domain-containing protein n=1 Tax=Actinobacillus equuli TaxID=718 RepID=UPI002442DDB5|nr:autotransporter outer membrane beta-barrel domain-containing protein [Actinobacillus equuli]WGE45975.1 autotransporter outer membrane beta-barrel domain-containing protein [Actinobacillus equuli subsp. haemolyticus]WGE52282.1 autotransporter outer membrane beta-barrel domain-containing protein [Actinobacillus equuli subsp. haemolyticus]